MIYLRVICIAFSFTVSPTPVCGRIVIGWGRAWRWSPIWICRTSSPITHQGYTAARLWNVKATYSSEKGRTTWLTNCARPPRLQEMWEVVTILWQEIYISVCKKSVPQHSPSQSQLVSTGLSKKFTSDFVEKSTLLLNAICVGSEISSTVKKHNLWHPITAVKTEAEQRSSIESLTASNEGRETKMAFSYEQRRNRWSFF